VQQKSNEGQSKEGQSKEGLLFKAVPFERAKQVLNRMAEVRGVDGELWVKAEPALAKAIEVVLAARSIRVGRVRRFGLEDVAAISGAPSEEGVILEMES